jgi:broad specificity phosphatase PhoE
MKLLSIAFWVFIMCSSSAASSAESATDSTSDKPTTIYMVRHAEKADEANPDPSLTNAGFARAEDLKTALIDASIDAIIVSELQRTQLTAQPLADHLGLQLIVIPIQELGVQNYIQGVVDEINNNWVGKDVLVVTHNPLYQLIGLALNTPALPAIDDLTGYDHFFTITKSADPLEQAKLSHTRYGAAPQTRL